MLGDVGGLYSALYSLLGLFVKGITSSNAKFESNKQMYTVKKEDQSRKQQE